jgi:hypothetical protein
VTAPASAPATVHAPATTLTARATVRRFRLWLVFAAIALFGVLALAALAGSSGAAGAPYSITNPGPGGSKALAEVLRAQGVDVIEAGTLEKARRETEAAPGATLFFGDINGYLTNSRLREAAALSRTVVLFLPGSDELRAFTPGIVPAGAPKNVDGVDAECTLPAARKAGSIISKGSTYRDIDGEASQLCFPSSDDAYSLVQISQGGTTVSVLGAADTITNEGITGAGNAALALNLLGENDTLVWYIPTADDVEADGPPDIASLTPSWVTPVLTLAVVTAIAAAVWRGRRFGALVAENLPVTVRSRETMEGRARLYARSGAHGRALDALRIGTISRLARILALPGNASVTDVIRAAATVLPGWPQADIEAILVTAVPANDRDLVALSDRLLVLERAVTENARP